MLAIKSAEWSTRAFNGRWVMVDENLVEGCEARAHGGASIFFFLDKVEYLYVAERDSKRKKKSSGAFLLVLNLSSMKS